MPGNWAGQPGWPAEECRGDGRFTDLRAVRYRQEQYYTGRCLGFPASLSRYRVLPPDRRERAPADTAQVLEAHGGGIETDHFSDLFLARAG